MAKDHLLNKLEVGDCVHFECQGRWYIGKVLSVREGGSIIPLDQKQNALTAGVVVVSAEFFFNFDPRTGVVPNLLKVNDASKKGVE